MENTLRADLLEFLNDYLKIEEFQDYGPNGLQIEGREKLQNIAFSVSATLESIESAIDWGADTLIVHHGLFWGHQGSRPIIGPWGKRVLKLIKNNINLVAYHLPLDAHSEVGNAAQIAKKLGMLEQKPFGEYKKQPLGVQAVFPKPLSAHELSSLLEKLLNHPIIHSFPKNKSFISSMGIITGGANNQWEEALNLNLDAYLTGEISEYNWHDAQEAGIHYFAGGHHATERFGVLALMDLVSRQFQELKTIFIDSPNPA